MTLRGAVLTLRYAKRALFEAGSVAQLSASLRAQIRVANYSIECAKLCDKLCLCSPQLPLDPVQCIACMLAKQLWRVASHPDHHTTQQQIEHIDEVYRQLAAVGYQPFVTGTD